MLELRRADTIFVWTFSHVWRSEVNQKSLPFIWSDFAFNFWLFIFNIVSELLLLFCSFISVDLLAVIIYRWYVHTYMFYQDKINRYSLKKIALLFRLWIEHKWYERETHGDDQESEYPPNMMFLNLLFMGVGSGCYILGHCTSLWRFPRISKQILKCCVNASSLEIFSS